MVYQIDLQDLESLNHLIFDASVEFEDLEKLSIESPIELKLERRSFENVKRKKFLFWSSTTFDGKTSLLKLHGVKDIQLEGIDDRFKNNHFINEIAFNSLDNALELKTVFGLRIKFVLDSGFRGELIDIGDSDFGTGSLFGSKGFTKNEWDTRNK
ncbi:hypothetical protein [Pontibacter amylolyticus]|uniref:Uncharacterized protein n=1 Tax=Pontibacter amylolyticus TaxID=1424080 RepID=A0ABQ1VVS8_9BACT|nr:hypothetical protein [Pontibacter amylolyticus]GGG01889.1 hypothetical protein GCM10011323_03470 [Pontibacter amylolyticus]